MRLLKRLHTIGLSMFVWSPNSKKSQMKHWLHRVCVSWGVHTQTASRYRYILQCSCRMKLVGRAGLPMELIKQATLKKQTMNVCFRAISQCINTGGNHRSLRGYPGGGARNLPHLAPLALVSRPQFGKSARHDMPHLLQVCILASL